MMKIIGSASLPDHVEYEISVNDSTSTIKKRFNDFLTLHRTLSLLHPSKLIPFLPQIHPSNKFDKAFIQNRIQMLQLYLTTLHAHPSISVSETYINFSTDTKSAQQQQTLVDAFTDTLLNTFSTLKTPDPTFVRIAAVVTQTLAHLESIHSLHSKMLLSQTAVESITQEMATSMNGYADVETNLTREFREISVGLGGISLAMNERNVYESRMYLNQIGHYIGLCTQMMTLLRLRDQKQIDYEQLAVYLQTYESDRESTVNPFINPSFSLTKSHIIHRPDCRFIKQKVDEVKGVDAYTSKQIHLEKLDVKIKELTEAVSNSKDEGELFSKDVEEEFAWFEGLLKSGFGVFAAEFIDRQVDMNQKCCGYWTAIAQAI